MISSIKRVSLNQSVCHEHDTYDSVCSQCMAMAINSLIAIVERMDADIRDLQRLETEG